MAIYLFMLFIDWVTEEKDGVGIVLGGKPITYADVAARYKFSRRSYWMYLKVLEKHNYIKTERGHHGIIISVNKSKKRRKLNVQDTAHQTVEERNILHAPVQHPARISADIITPPYIFSSLNSRIKNLDNITCVITLK